MDSCTCSFNSFITSSDVCCLLITYASSLDPDQDQPKRVHYVILKKTADAKKSMKKTPSMQRVKEGVDTCALSAIRRRAVKCSGGTAQLVRITCAFFCHSCNKDLIFIDRFVTDV